MNQNSPYHLEVLVNDFQKTNSGSIFDLSKSNDALLEQSMVLKKQAFESFVNSRNEYLESLNLLGNNWISGSSRQPTEESINISKKFLSDIGNWYSFGGFKKYVYPKIIMGPMPSGGVGMEIELFPSLRAYISIYDKNRIDYEIEKDGHFMEIEIDKDNLSNQLLNLYSIDERGYDSRW